MGLLTTYLRWRGDLSFRTSPFNIFDELICSGIAYFDFKDSYMPGTERKLGELLDTMMSGGSFRTTSLDRRGVASDFICELALSERFRAVSVVDCADEYSSEDNVQFAAVTLKLDDGSAVVAYRGTDDSLTGWREDFMITFTKPKAQELALSYLERTLRKYRNVYVCGHSKGGNLALYAGCFLNDRELKRVRRIYINDGPGLCSDVISKDRLERIDSKTTMVLPADSVVGRIFEPEFTDRIIVKTAAQGVRAHSIYSWRVEDNDLVRAKKFSKGSDLIKRGLEHLLENESLEERRNIVDAIFDTLREGGYERLSDFREEGFSELLGLFAKKIEKDISKADLKKAFLNRLDSLRERLSKLREQKDLPFTPLPRQHKE